MSMLKNLPTTLWMVGATVAVAAFSPVVGGVATSAPAPAPAPPPAAKASSPPKATPSAEATPPEPEQSVAPGKQVEGEVVIGRAETVLGPTAVDAEGYTLYLSVLDSSDPPESVCLSKKCLTAWRPVYLPPGIRPTAGAGIDPDLLGRVRRPDRTWQATLGGWPLYRYYADTQPGDVRGEGLKGTWHAIGPDGRKAAR
jgi:predicted lipoprotein with Yx(FWY)xxD motif